MAGKGDTYRPVNQKVYEDNYERIFGKKKLKRTKKCKWCEESPAEPGKDLCGGCQQLTDSR